jgi:superfamily I DNA/RNA helicase
LLRIGEHEDPMAQPTLPLPIGRQKDVLYLPSRGHFVVLGTAGSGKTTLAILRAAYLGNPNTDNNGQTLLVTFNRALVSYLRQFQGSHFRNVVVENYHLFARGYLNSRGRMRNNSICDGNLRELLVLRAILATVEAKGDHAVLGRGFEFFSKEIEWIQQHGINSAQDYVQIERIVRGETPLNEKSRALVFDVYEEYLSLRKAERKDFDWDDMANGVCEELDNDASRRRYKHVVIDEGQDFSPQMIRSLAKAIPSDGSLTFFGDMAQQIYGQRMTWRSAGLNIAQVWEFKENYRNTRQIADVALAIGRMPYYEGTPDIVEPVSPRADGPLPALVECPSTRREIALVLELAVQAGKTQTVAILGRTWGLVDAIARQLPRSAIKLHRELTTWQAGPGIYYGTFYGAKGLEFDTVFLPFLTNSNIPDKGQVKGLGEEGARSVDGKLLYVGVTRAKTRLVITFAGNITELLPPDKTLYQASKA